MEPFAPHSNSPRYPVPRIPVRAALQRLSAPEGTREKAASSSGTRLPGPGESCSPTALTGQVGLRGVAAHGVSGAWPVGIASVLPRLLLGRLRRRRRRRGRLIEGCRSRGVAGRCGRRHGTRGLVTAAGGSVVRFPAARHRRGRGPVRVPLRAGGLGVRRRGGGVRRGRLGGRRGRRRLPGVVCGQRRTAAGRRIDILVIVAVIAGAVVVLLLSIDIFVVVLGS